LGDLTLMELIGEVQGGLLNRTDLANDRVVRAINFAQTRISRGHDFKEMKGFYNVSTQFTSNPFNDKFVPLAAFIKHVHTVVLKDGTNSRKLVEKPWRQFDRTWPMPEALGRSRSQVYSRWGQNLVLYPVPDGVYALFMRVTQFPRPFNLITAPNAVSDFESKDDLIIAEACAYLWKSFGRPDKANDFLQESVMHFQAAVKQDSDIPDMEIGLDISTENLGQYWADPFVRISP
jgi:hypothetical protein